MPATVAEEAIQTFEITKDERIRASIDIVFETLLEQLGPLNERGDGVPMPMKIEPWPGGRWYRDLGDDNGHLWGHVQAIKKPTLLEICGPLMMSLAVANNVQYRLTAEGNETRLQFAHRGIGPIPAQQREGMHRGWGMIYDRIRAAAEKKENKA
ncbi:MAG TPA: SRPBCC domain-containing protein [Bryobacteraceae bacterium]|jgi:hypothetical protein|nr:SRPBCC domain-containing protein [Bryobacteraceae bacterium]